MNDKEFWNWFLTKKAKIEEFIVSPGDDYSTYTELVEKLRSYSELVMAELTQDTENNNILVLTCDGRREGIEPIEKLYDSAPTIDSWKIQKFRAPGHVKELNFDGLTLKATDIKVDYESDGRYFDVKLYIRGYNDSDNRYKSLAFLYLDHFVGEYNVMTKIGRITFKKLGILSKPKNPVELQELRAIVERLN